VIAARDEGNQGRATKRVFRFFSTWNDRWLEWWLTEQERAGWRLARVGLFSFRFERVVPAEVAYRLDIGPSSRRDCGEYLGLFRDAVWEHVGSCGIWQYFRKPVLDGEVPQIHTDPRSRLAMCRRLLAFLATMLGALVLLFAPSVARLGRGLAPYRWLVIVELLLVLAYGCAIVQVLLGIRWLKREGVASRPSGQA
jgi:hypothetical protein